MSVSRESALRIGRPSRRGFLKWAGLLVGGVAGLSACRSTSVADGAGKGENDGVTGRESIDAEATNDAGAIEELIAEPNPDNPFGVDLNVNMGTIDRYLGRPDVAYRDMRMLSDPADFAAIGGNAELDRTLEGFRITPFPYMSTMPALTVEGAYEGPCLLSVEWGEDNRSVVSAMPNYADALAILEELFPKHKKLFLMCGGGGYAGMMRALLVHLGWDADKVFNVGGNWDYEGPNGVYLISYDVEGRPTYRRWRADYAMVEFDLFKPIDGELPEGESFAGRETTMPHEKGRQCIVA